MVKRFEFRVSLALACIAAMVVAAAAFAANPHQAQPPGGVYTCKWIAAHPTDATLARVSCNEDMTNPGSTVTPAEVQQAGSLSASSRFTTLGSGCQRVPGSGAIGQGVFASTTAEYADHWEWPAGSQGGYYTWYLKLNSDDSTIDFGSQFAGDTKYTASNVEYWKVQNHDSSAQYWDCVTWSG